MNIQHSMKFIFTILLLLVLQPFVLAQSANTDSIHGNSTFDEIGVGNINLPPVSVFLDAAKTYSEVRYLDERINEQKLLLTISKKEWLKYFRIQGNYQYGTNNSYMLQSNDGFPTDGGVASLSTQSWYNAGVALAIPLDDIFSRKNKNDVVRSRVKQLEYETSTRLESRQILILESYNNVLKHLALIKVKAESVALYDAQMKMSEKDFSNGRIDIITLSLERARRSSAVIQFQETRAELHNAVTILEMLTGIKILNR